MTNAIPLCDAAACVQAGCTATVCRGLGIPSNQSFFERSSRAIPGGVNSSIRAFKAVGGTPYIVSRASGAYVYDVEGNELIDLVQSYGAIILGHAHPKVTEAIRSAAGDGTSYGAPTPREMKLAEAIAERVPSCERVRFMKLEAGKVIGKHSDKIDKDLGFDDGQIMRIHVPIRTNDDVVGAEYAAMLKNIYAIAAGMAHGLGYGDNFQSVLMSNAIREMKQYVKIVHKMKRDINNSAYLGDLLVTGYSVFSRNRMLGNMIGKGYTVKAALVEMTMIAEGYYGTKTTYEMSTAFDGEYPILECVYQVLYEKGNAKKKMNLLSKLLD